MQKDPKDDSADGSAQRKRSLHGAEAQDTKKLKVDGEERLTSLIAKVGDNEEFVVKHLIGLTEALIRDLPLHYYHIINQIMKSVFTLPHKMGVYSTLVALLMKRCGEAFGSGSAFAKGGELGTRVVKLTVEMLDRNLVDSVWWKTMVLMKFASELMLAKVMHPQNMWNLLREIVDEVLSISNSPNRRDAYCYMVLASLEIVGLELQHFHKDLKAGGKTTAEGPEATVELKKKHKPVDFPALFDDLSYFMRNRDAKEEDQESPLMGSWREIQRLHAESWKSCTQALATRPYNLPELKDRLPAQTPLPVHHLPRTKARGARAARHAAAESEQKVTEEEDLLHTYLSRITDCQKRGDAEDAYRMWNEIRQKGVTPNSSAYSAILEVCASKGDVRRASAFWEQLPGDHVTPTASLYNHLLNVYVAASDEGLFARFEEMKRGGVTPDIHTFLTLASGCEQLGRAEAAVELLQELRAFHVSPNTAFCAAVLQNCRAQGDVTLCGTLWNELTRDYGVEPDGGCYRAVEAVFQRAAELNGEEFRKKSEVLRARSAAAAAAAAASATTSEHSPKSSPLNGTEEARATTAAPASAASPPALPSEAPAALADKGVGHALGASGKGSEECKASEVEGAPAPSTIGEEPAAPSL